jgi:glycosyltransferase involved in cell wall biosynthesis
VKIVIAPWHLKDFNVGLARYAAGLIGAIGKVDTKNQYEIVTPHKINGFPAHPNIRYRTIRIPFFKRRVWEQIAPLLCRSHDILHLPYDSCVALKRGKLIVTIHDVKPILFHTGQTNPNWIERLLIPDHKKMIDHVVTISEASRRDIIAHLGFNEDLVTVVNPGIDMDRFRPVHSTHASDQPSQSKHRKYVLCVGGADPTKNVETLIDAFSVLPQGLKSTYNLILAGDFRRRDDIRQRVAKAGIETLTIFSGIVSDERLIELYQHATVFVFPSRYEGFGLPVLEAMACGCPVISSNASSLPEVAGDAALLVDPADVGGFVRSMERVLTDAALRQSMRERGLARAAQFPWERTARETIAVYQNVLGQTYG